MAEAESILMMKHIEFFDWTLLILRQRVRVINLYSELGHRQFFLLNQQRLINELDKIFASVGSYTLPI